MSVELVLLGCAVFVVRIVREFTGRMVTARNLVVLPAVLLVIGGVRAVPTLSSVSGLAVALLAADAVVVLGLGAARGASVRLTVRDGGLFQRGGWLTAGLWLLSIAARVVIVVLGHALGVGAPLDATVLAGFGLTLVAQSCVVFLRARGLEAPTASLVSLRMPPSRMRR